MAMTRRFRKKVVVYLLLCRVMRQTIAALLLVIDMISSNRGHKRLRCDEMGSYSIISRMKNQNEYLSSIIYESDGDCVINCRMDRNAFARLCHILRHFGGLVDNKYVRVEEQVIIFLKILAHHKKNRIIKFDFKRSPQMVSRYVHLVLRAVLKASPMLLATPHPSRGGGDQSKMEVVQGLFRSIGRDVHSRPGLSC